MSIGLMGYKEGQSRQFEDDGSSCHVTLVSLEPNMVTQLKTVEKEGYSAVQVAVGDKKKVNKATQGHLKKSGLKTARRLKEWRVDDAAQFELGKPLDTEWLTKITSVDVVGITKGKGFAGCVKRHNFKTQDASHGNSLSHRAPGSIGQCQDPGRVFKGKAMPGRLGGTQVTVSNIKILDYIAEENLLVLKGALPGANGGLLFIKPSLKHKVKD
jgi:large subunit ribosomal protein L3